MRILFHDPCFDRMTGAQRSMLTLASACRENDVQPVVVTLAEGPLLEAARADDLDTDSLRGPRLLRRWSGANTSIGRWAHRGLNLVLFPLLLLRALYLTHARQPSVICVNSAGGALLFGVWARLFDIPLVWYMRLAWDRPLVVAVAGRLASRILLISRDLMATFSPEQQRRWERKIEVLHTGFPAPERRSATTVELERELATEQGVEMPDVHPRFLLLASYDPRKGHADALAAFAAYVRAGGAGVLLFCGHASHDDAYISELKASAEALGVSNTVLFLKETHLPRALIRVCDTIILPSRSEGLPRVVVEALAEGREVIAYPVSGARELIRDEHCGVVLARPEPELLAMAMRERVDADVAGRFSDERQAAVAHLTVQRYTDRFLAICADLRTGR